MLRRILTWIGIVAFLVLAVIWVCAWAPARGQCNKRCKGKGYPEGSQAVIGWVLPSQCICRGAEFPLWERKKP